MTLDELLKINPDFLTLINLNDFFNEQDISNLSKKDLDKIIKRFGVKVFMMPVFPQVYDLIATDHSNKAVKYWTVAIGFMTLVTTAATIVNLFIAISGPK